MSSAVKEVYAFKRIPSRANKFRRIAEMYGIEFNFNGAKTLVFDKMLDEILEANQDRLPKKDISYLKNKYSNKEGFYKGIEADVSMNTEGFSVQDINNILDNPESYKKEITESQIEEIEDAIEGLVSLNSTQFGRNMIKKRRKLQPTS